MLRPLATYVGRLDATYRDRPYFVGLKARLLAGFALLLAVFVPVNLVKLLWLMPPELPFRLLFNVGMGLAALLALRWVRSGKLERAGNGMALVALLPVHGLLFVAPAYVQPMSVAVQMLAFDFVFLLFALVFASRRVAFAVLGLVILSYFGFYTLAFRHGSIAGTLQFAADTWLRDGLIAIGFVFCLGFTVVYMIESAHRRSEESLRETRALNENLEQKVSERTRDLEAATRRANDASRAKSDFLANMSHEIRTPLNGIVASADLLRRRSDLSAEAAEHARLIAESGELLMRLLGDILDFSKIEAGQLRLEQHTFELAPLIADNVALVAARAAESGVQLEHRVSPGLARYLVGDSFRLRQVLLNLVSNAIKFTPAGGRVLVTAVCDEPKANPASVRFEVRDSGIGMDAGTMARIFERFTQADSSTTRRYGGTGLGLAISSRLVAMMGGRLQAESTTGHGSLFSFTLVFQTADTPGEAAPAGPVSVALGLDVLVVEDNLVNRKIFAAQLGQLGCRFTMAVDGEEALQVLSRDPAPDLVLMDCHMPKLDGWEAARRIRAWATDPVATMRQSRAAALPIIALTAAALPEERRRCLDAGMNVFLAKPAKLADLREVLQPFARLLAETK